jgi:hypothetical protein
VWTPDSMIGMLVVLASGGAAAAAAACVLSQRAQSHRPSSYPGGPRAERGSYRSPQWPSQRDVGRLPPGWRLVTGLESHRLTHGAHSDASDICLTGEAAGRHVWFYDEQARATGDPSQNESPFDASVNPNAEDQVFRGAQLAKWRQRHGSQQKSHSVEAQAGADEDGSSSSLAAARLGVSFYERLQCEDGHWGGDYGGPLFLLPGLVIVAHVTGSMGSMLPPRHKEAMILYLRNHQQSDGGWGTHIESASTMFGSVLCYVSLRLLGVSADDSAAQAARKFIHTHGGATHTGSWAKFWLAVLGVYEWAGVNPIPVEMWLLPGCACFHPWRMWCHARMVYLPMGYLYCSRFVYHAASTDPQTRALRSELYVPGTEYPPPSHNYHDQDSGLTEIYLRF